MAVRDVLTIFQINEIFIWTPSKNCKIHYLSKDFSLKYFWFNDIIHLCRCDSYRLFTVLEYTRHVLKKNIWRHKNTCNLVLDVTVNLCNKSLKKLARLKYFSIIKIVSFFDIYLASGSLNIAAHQSSLIFPFVQPPMIMYIVGFMRLA